MKIHSKISKTIENAIKEKVFPGCVVGVIIGDDRVVLPFGTLTYEPVADKVTENTIYDVASITKSIPTAMLALWLVDNKKIKLEDHVIQYIPEFTAQFAETVTVFHLLTHTVSFNLRLSALKDERSENILDAIYTTPLRDRGGSAFSYVNATSIVLGKLIERVSEESLNTLAAKVYFDPLGMNMTTFFPAKEQFETIAPTEIDRWRGREIRGEVHDESAYTLGKLGAVGSAGLFSNVPDLMQSLQMLLAGGKHNGVRYLSKELIEEIETNQITSLGQSTGLGFELYQPWYMGKYATVNTLGKTGFTGCHMVGDRKQRKGFIMLSNSTYPVRPDSKDKMNAVRREIADVILSS